MQHIATFSIVAYDPARREWGVAVQSKFLAAAAVVSWARAGAGSVATQSYANLAYGPKGLGMMEQGMPAKEVIAALIDADEDRALRQVGVVDQEGRPRSPARTATSGPGISSVTGSLARGTFSCRVPSRSWRSASIRYERARVSCRIGW